MTSDVDIPEYMRRTVAMLRSAYPDGIPTRDRLALMAVLRDAGMSNRSVGAAIGYVLGRLDPALSYEASIASLDEGVTDDAKRRVRELLDEHGYGRWLADED